MHDHASRSPLGYACALAAMAAIAGCSSGQPVAKKSESIPAVSVKTVEVAATPIQRTTLQPATVHAYFRAEIRSMATGFVKELKADIGQYVEAGDELAVIDVPELNMQRQILEARILKFEAEEQRAQAGGNLAQARVRSALAKLAEAQSKMGSVEASLAGAQAEFNRTEDLVQRGSLQNRMLDEVRMKRDSEAASKEAMESSIASAHAEVAVAEAQVASAEADSGAARAETEIGRRELEAADVMIAYATIKAPFAGLVTQRNVEPGDLVREQSEVGKGGPLFVISQVDKVRVRIPVPELDAPSINPGDEVTLTLPSFSAEAPLVGSVTRRSGSLDPSTRTMMVEAEMQNPDGKLLPGMFGQATIKIAAQAPANMLPSQAIRFEEGGKAFVYVVGQNETVSIAEVTTGIDDGNLIEVLSGVEPGQRVIGSHLKRFTEGQKVNPL